MWKKLIPGFTLISASLFLLGVSESVVRSQQLTETKDNLSRTIVRVADYVITAKDLSQIIDTYPPGSLSSREAKMRLVESLITGKLFALAAGEAKLDAAEDFPRARERAREDVLAYAYFKRHVKPKFTEEQARKYFTAHKEEYGNFTFYRTRIMDLLKDQALRETNQALKQQFGVKQRDDVLKDLDLRSSQKTSRVLAQVGPATVTVGDLKEIAPLHRRTDFSTLAAKKDLLETVVLERVYALAAKKAGFENNPGVRKALERSEDQLLATRYIRLLEGKVTLEDARRYYKAHPADFRRPQQIRLRQIVVAGQEEALAVKLKLSQGVPFEEVARAASSDRASAAKGGEIGWVRKGGRLYPEVERVAFRLKPNQVSQPIKTPDGYYIVRIEEWLEGTVRPFNEVASHVLMQLKSRAVEAERQRLMKVYKVTINQGSL